MYSQILLIRLGIFEPSKGPIILRQISIQLRGKFFFNCKGNKLELIYSILITIKISKVVPKFKKRLINIISTGIS